MDGIVNSHDTAPLAGRGSVAFLLVSIVVLLVAAVPAALGTDDWGPVVAWVLTFVPGAAIVSQARRFSDSRQSMPYMFFSMVLRLVVSFGGGLLAVQLVPALPRTPFLLWLAGMYFVALAAEIYLTLFVNSWWATGRPSVRAARPLNHLQGAGQ